MKKTMKIISLLIVVMLLFTNFVFAATATSDPTDLKEFVNKKTTVATDAGKTLNAVLSIIQVIGISVAIIMLIVLGIKYIVSSVADRAEIKKHAVVYVVGAILMFGASGIVQIIKNFSKNI